VSQPYLRAAPFLRATAVIDHDHPAVAAKAAELRGDLSEPIDIARACYLFVRDAISHSVDARANPLTCRASEVLAHGTGYCFAKSHLLAALLRANGIPAGLCYQRLSIDDIGPPFTLHGLNAMELPGIGWHRIDPRGNKPGVFADFTPPLETLAYAPKLPGEADLPEIHADPLPVVIERLAQATTWDGFLAGLPDLPLVQPGPLLR
jgi:transglutaminase-like putative cysteine protease